MPKFISELYQTLGIFYTFVFICAFVALLLVGQRYLSRRPPKRRAFGYLFAAMLPLLIGIYGMIEANNYIDLNKSRFTPEQLKVASQEAWSTVYVGGVLTAVFGVIGIVLISRPRIVSADQ